MSKTVTGSVVQFRKFLISLQHFLYIRPHNVHHLHIITKNKGIPQQSTISFSFKKNTHYKMCFANLFVIMQKLVHTHINITNYRKNGLIWVR